jgi:hypothetical protein
MPGLHGGAPPSAAFAFATAGITAGDGGGAPLLQATNIRTDTAISFLIVTKKATVAGGLLIDAWVCIRS